MDEAMEHRNFAAAFGYIGKLFAQWVVPKWCLAGVIAVMEYALPGAALQNAAGAAGALILLDTLSGLVAARISGHPISSAKFSRVLVKLLGYSLVLAVVSLALRSVEPLAPVQHIAVTAVLGLITWTEAISILENVVRMGVPVPSALMSFVRGRVHPTDLEQAKPDPLDTHKP